ncbi:MAG: hypothetical protein RL662_1749 [Bacteroidota bacterium]|jgi:hypothetical protein
MKAKKSILVLGLVASVGLFTSTVKANETITGGGDIFLNYGMALEPSVSVWTSGAGIEVYFGGNLGAVYTSLQDANGNEVYGEWVDTANVSNTFIDSFDLTGTYTLVSTTSNGVVIDRQLVDVN